MFKDTPCDDKTIFKDGNYVVDCEIVAALSTTDLTPTHHNLLKSKKGGKGSNKIRATKKKKAPSAALTTSPSKGLTG